MKFKQFLYYCVNDKCSKNGKLTPVAIETKDGVYFKGDAMCVECDWIMQQYMTIKPFPMVEVKK